MASDDSDQFAHVGARIRKLRTERGMTLDELSDAAGLGGKANASNIERNHVLPNLVTLSRIAHVFGLPLAALATDPPSRERIARLVEALPDAALTDAEAVLAVVAAAHRGAAAGDGEAPARSDAPGPRRRGR